MFSDYETLKTIVDNHHDDLARSVRSSRTTRRRSGSRRDSGRRWWR
jgi:hypothetical protein